jgi:serine/threonine protein kinase
MAGRYEILDRLATGGMAEIYRARAIGAEGFRKLVVVKKILPSFTSDPEFVRMFVEEAKLAAKLHHGNIVQVYDLGRSEDGEYFIVMELVEGHDLGDLLDDLGRRGERLGVGEAIAIARQVCAGLDYAHRKRGADGKPLGIIHRDVSPQNVLISFEGEVKLTDFGIAKARTRAETTQVGFLKGKYGYMSPEQARGEALDQRSDLFNVGILLYEMLAGERLFEGSDDHSTLHQMRNAEVVPLVKVRADLPEALTSIVQKALAPRPEGRFQSAAALDQALAHLSFDLGVVVSGADLARRMEQVYGRPSSSPEIPSGTRVIDLQGLADGGPRAFSTEPLAAGAGAPAPRPPTVSLQPGRPLLRVREPAGEVPLPAWVRGGAVVLSFAAALGLSTFLSAPDAAPTAPALPVRVPPASAPADGGPARGAGGESLAGLLVTASPPEARVVMDGEARARTTPAWLEASAGAHTIRVERPGFEPASTQVVAAAGETRRVDLTLSPRRLPLRIRTHPAGASLTVDGEGRGRSPRTLRLAPGSHRVVARKKGYFAAVTRVEMDGRRRVNLWLARRTRGGTLEVQTYPRATVQIASRTLETGAAPVRIHLPAGRHRLEISAGDLRRALWVEIRPGEATRVFVDLVLSSPRP